MSSDPTFGRYRFLRGFALERLNRYDESVVEYTNALNLLGDPTRVARSEFFNIARVYALNNMHCAAMGPILQWISFDPGARDTAQTQAVLKEYNRRGACQREDAARKVVAQARSGVMKVEVTVNGSKGTFVVDTGASYVTLTNEFAKRSNIALDELKTTIANTPNGPTKTFVGTADAIAVGQLYARQVPLLVLPSSPLGKDIDGLLGMSFLGRFEVKISAKGVEMENPKGRT